jgi:DNA-binding SARP family transcriptional activator
MRASTPAANTAERASMTPSARLSLLGGFELRQAGRVVRLPLSAQRLLVFVALQEHPVRRAYVAGQMWTESTQEHANASLRTTLWRLREPGRLLERRGGEIQLGPDLAVDARELAARAERALAHRTTDDDVRRLTHAGDLLPDWYDDWLVVERERIRQLRLNALEAICADFAARGRFAAALDAGLAAVTAEPLRESAHRAVIDIHLARGNAAEGLRQYHLYRRLLRDELQLVPSPAMRALVESIFSGGDGDVTAR